MRVCLFLWEKVNNFEHSIGVSDKEINVEKKTAEIIVTANSKNNFAVSPCKKIIGMKMLISTIEVDTIANKTSFDPSIAALSLVSPASILL